MRQDPFFTDIDRAFGFRAHGRFEPNTDVYIDEARGRMVVHVELAGSDGDELRVAIDDGSLYIMGTARTGPSTARHRSSKKKFYMASFTNAFACRCRSMIPARPLPIATASSPSSFRSRDTIAGRSSGRRSA